MYAAYQLHLWLKTVKIVGLYLVQQATLTDDCILKQKEAAISATLRCIQENLSPDCDFYGGKAVFTRRKLVESCAITT